MRISSIVVMAGLSATAVWGATELRPVATAPATVSENMSIEEIRQLVDGGQFKDALRPINHLLLLKGAAAAAFDRHEVLMLRAECQLQIRENRAATDTLEMAYKEAIGAKKDDNASQAAAMVLLIQRSPANIYTPKTGPIRKPVNILDRTLRKAAYDGMFADEFSVFQQKQKAAMAGRSLPPIVEAAKSAAAVHVAEKASTGSNQQTDQMIKDLSARAQKLLNTTLDELSAKSGRISQSANKEVTEEIPTTSGGMTFYQKFTHRRGLLGTDTQSLKDIEETCGKIPPAAADLAKAFTDDLDAYKAIADKSDTIKKEAETTLKDDYTVLSH